MPNFWRIIITDTESPTGVAPVCPAMDDHVIRDSGIRDDMGVYDCCPGPHIECWTERNAQRVLRELEDAGAEVCS